MNHAMMMHRLRRPTILLSARNTTSHQRLHLQLSSPLLHQESIAVIPESKIRRTYSTSSCSRSTATASSQFNRAGRTCTHAFGATLGNFKPWKKPAVRSLSSKSEHDDDDSSCYGGVKVNKSIIMNKKGLSHTILPGDMVKKTLKSGQIKIVHNITLGSFWMLKDLRETDNKPILSNTSLIPVRDAELLPSLKGLTSLSGNAIDLPDHFIKKDGTSENSCTLVALSYKDFGFKMLPKWIAPFEEAMATMTTNPHKRAAVVNINITEGTFLKLLSGLFTSSMKKNTPEDRHDSTLLYFGSVGDVNTFRDPLRMHNTLTGYVLLLDGLGRVRWVGSGPPDDEELQILIRCGKALTTDDNDTSSSGGGSGSSSGGSSNKRRTTKARVGIKVKR